MDFELSVYPVGEDMDYEDYYHALLYAIRMSPTLISKENTRRVGIIGEAKVTVRTSPWAVLVFPWVTIHELLHLFAAWLGLPEKLVIALPSIVLMPLALAVTLNILSIPLVELPLVATLALSLPTLATDVSHLNGWRQAC